MPGTLLHPPAHIIQQMLFDDDMAGNPETVGSLWPATTTVEQSAPDNAITIYDTTGQSFGKGMSTLEVMEREGVQLRIRGKTHAIGYVKAKALATYLDGLNYKEVVIDGQLYLLTSFSRRQPVLALGLDSTSKRYLFTINGTVSLRHKGTAPAGFFDPYRFAFGWY